MNIKLIVARKNDEIFNKCLFPSIQKHGCATMQLVDEPGVHDTIFTKYNQAITILLSMGMKPEDVYIFVHEDVALIDPYFKEKVELLFSTKDIALAGIAGSTILTESGGWWMNTPDKLRGGLIQGKDGGSEGESFYLPKGSVGYFDDVCCLDGCILMTTGKQLIDGLKFDTETFYNDNDMYDIDLSFSLLERGLTIAVTDILIYHKSMGKGAVGEAWTNSKIKLLDKWLKKGYTFPITKATFNKTAQPPQSNIVEIEV